ncbi:MAG: carbohydrate ABC transporter permease [Caldilineaceae bacterium]|nr:carbohydrate ABC transporter permease [Caldilineaceae bacterium]
MTTRTSAVHPGARQRSMAPIVSRYVEKALIYCVLLAGAAVLMIPLWWMLSTSVKHPKEVFAFPPTLLPEQFMWNNYTDLFIKAPFHIYIFNTTYLVIMDLIGTLFTASMVGYAFARLRWRGRDVFFLITLATMMLPNTVLLIPRFIIFNEIGWTNSFKPLWVPAFFGYAFFIFLMRQFYATIPHELDSAARIDGASEFGVWWRILAPLTKPALAACGIFTFNATWNDVLGPLIYLTSESKSTLALGLMQFRGPHRTDWHYLMAASVVAMLPVLIIFFFAQKYFIQGVTITGIKG